MTADLLAVIRARLDADVGKLRRVSAETDIPYDTILRIKNGEGDPGYSKVQALARHYRLMSDRRESADDRRAPPCGGRRALNRKAA